jgi:hypothetical protein
MRKCTKLCSVKRALFPALFWSAVGDDEFCAVMRVCRKKPPPEKVDSEWMRTSSLGHQFHFLVPWKPGVELRSCGKSAFYTNSDCTNIEIRLGGSIYSNFRGSLQILQLHFVPMLTSSQNNLS